MPVGNIFKNNQGTYSWEYFDQIEKKWQGNGENYISTLFIMSTLHLYSYDSGLRREIYQVKEEMHVFSLGEKQMQKD